MYQNKKFLALIPARGGSKGIPGKNIRDLGGKPLIAHTILAAKKSAYVDQVVVTTDSQEIARVAEEYGARIPCLRPTELASDQSKTIDAILHMVDFLKKEGETYDYLVLLQPTSPLRTQEDIDGAIALALEEGKDLVSLSPVSDHPILVRTRGEDGSLSKLLDQNSTLRRQDMPDYYRVNGAIYINVMENLSPETSFNDNPLGYLMEASHSVDIDEPVDFAMAEFYLDQED
ncbi:MAG: acylneuraminate cytidylyltransferase family protein [Eubacterium sp.]|nr:acylneuraminate cytidylyltransferase family protein [Eubacterium sp.]